MVLVLNRFRELEIYRRVVVVHAESYAVFNLLIIRMHVVVGVCELVDAAECQQWFDLHADILDIVKEGVFDNQAVGVVLEKQ